MRWMAAALEGRWLQFPQIQDHVEIANRPRGKTRDSAAAWIPIASNGSCAERQKSGMLHARSGMAMDAAVCRTQFAEERQKIGYETSIAS